MRSRVVLSVGLCLAGCRGKPAKVEPAPVPAASHRSADQLLPGELAEGKEQAFGLSLPRGMRVERRFSDWVTASGYLPLESVSTFVRKRVDADRIDVGPARTVFTRARTKQGAGSTILRIEVGSLGDQTELIVRDATPPPLDPGLTESERWNKAGLAPGGKQTDTTHLQ